MTKLEKKSNMKFALFVEDYGPFKKDQSYIVQNEGKDWLACKNGGKIYFVNKGFTHPNPFSYLT